MGTPKVIVCLPTYNRSGYLLQTLASVLSQTFTDFEVIVSDNCSTDSTADVVRACGDPRIRYIRNERNIGLFPNMNQCLELARGDYVCILHDDDVYAPRFLEREAGMLDRYPSAGFVHCATYEIDASGRRRRLVQTYPDDCLRGRHEEFARYLGGHNVRCSTVMGRREPYRQTGGFDPASLCADFPMWLRLSLKADVAYVAEPLVSMRVHMATTSSSLEPSRWCREFLAILERGLCLAESTHSSLLRSKDRVRRWAIRAQGNRFFVAAVAAITSGSFSVADGYIGVLRELEERGLPRPYRILASALRNRMGQRLLFHARRLRRARDARNLPVEAVW